MRIQKTQCFLTIMLLAILSFIAGYLIYDLERPDPVAELAPPAIHFGLYDYENFMRQNNDAR